MLRPRACRIRRGSQRPPSSLTNVSGNFPSFMSLTAPPIFSENSLILPCALSMSTDDILRALQRRLGALRAAGRPPQAYPRPRPISRVMNPKMPARLPPSARGFHPLFIELDSDLVAGAALRVGEIRPPAHRTIGLRLATAKGRHWHADRHAWSLAEARPRPGGGTEPMAGGVPPIRPGRATCCGAPAAEQRHLAPCPIGPSVSSSAFSLRQPWGFPSGRGTLARWPSQCQRLTPERAVRPSSRAPMARIVVIDNYDSFHLQPRPVSRDARRPLRRGAERRLRRGR